MNKFTSTAIQVIEVWRQLDPKHNRLVKLKTEAAAAQLRKEIKAETMQIRFRNRGNSNSGIIPGEILAMELRKIDAWASQYYTICCDVWELQGNKKSAASVRTIYTHFLRKLIAIRKSSVAHEAQRSACATGRFDNIARLRIESFKRSADQLSRDWRKKIEIEALELEAGARSEKSGSRASFIPRIGEAGSESTPHIALTNEAMPRKPSTRTTGSLKPERINPVTPKAQERKLLPGATIYGVRPDSNEYVAWDGEQYVLCQTKERVLADDGLLLIGSVQELKVDHPHPGRMDRVEVVIPAPQLENGIGDHGPEPTLRQGNVEVSANDTLENSKDTILSRAAGAVNETLLREVTRSFKALFKFHYESAEEVGQSPEWEEMSKLFCDAADTYVNIAMNNRRKIPGDLFLRVKDQIEANESAILIQHFGCDRNGYLIPKKISQNRAADHHDAWSAQAHMGWMNHNSVFWVCQKNVVRAGSVALDNAAIRIASGSPPLRPVNQSVSQTGADPQAGLVSTRSSAPLSTFEATVGELMAQARKGCPTKHLPQTEILKLAELLDNKKILVRDNLERGAARTMAKYNQQYPKRAVKTWQAVLSLPQFRRSVRKRFSRAEEKYKKAIATAQSAGTPRTTI